MRFYPLLVILTLVLAGCANPVNQATYNRYYAQGEQAFSEKKFQLAAVNFSRAAQNVDMGRLGDGQKARALYNAGESLRLWGGDFESAESMLLQAQAISEKIWNDAAHTAERNALLVGLTLLYSDINNPAKGWTYLSRTFGQPDPRNIQWKTIYEIYEPMLIKHGMTNEAEKLREEIKKN